MGEIFKYGAEQAAADAKKDKEGINKAQLDAEVEDRLRDRMTKISAELEATNEVSNKAYTAMNEAWDNKSGDSHTAEEMAVYVSENTKLEDAVSKLKELVSDWNLTLADIKRRNKR